MREEAPAGFVVMAKPVGSRCNLECGYCYYSPPGHSDKSPDPFRMTDAMLDTYIRQYIEAAPGPIVSFTWHGGEPTLAGLDFYRRAVELQKRYLPEGRSCWNNLQTNGVLLDDEWCAFLSEYRFDVGLSLDGTRWLHDQYRKDRGGQGSYQRASAAVRRLQEHGIQPDLLCTVTSASAREPLAVYRALREFGTGWLQFIPIVRRGADNQATPDSVTGAEYGSFLRTIFDEWIYRDLGRLGVQVFAEAMLVWSGGTASLCWMAPTCGRALIVERDGGVYSCDHFVDSNHRLGDIGNTHLGVLADSPDQLRFGNDKRDLLPGQCRSCPWLSVCNGGCPKDRFAVSEDGEPGLNFLCAGLRGFFEHAHDPLTQVIRLGRQGMTPDTIMSRLRADAASRWKGVGRNDPCPCGSGRKAKHCCWSTRP